MRHFVQYHNPGKMGPYKPAKKDLWIVTNKPGELCVGDTMWLVTGEARPRRYFLCETFVVEKIDYQSGGEFRYKASGTVGRSFDPLVEIGFEAWFEELLKTTGNFRFGLTEIKNGAILEAFQRISEL